MEAEVKKVVNVPKRTEPFMCEKCKHTVNPNLGKPVTIETDKVILHSWDYGHQHKKVFQIIGKHYFIIEGSEEE